MRQRWLLIVAGPALFLLVGSVLALLFVPHPIPKTATPVQRLYLGQCAGCHGANGHGSWHATILLIRPGNLGDALTLRERTDDYVFDLIKNGGAPIGKPGMPAFGFHLSDAQIRELVRYVRTLPGPVSQGDSTRGDRPGWLAGGGEVRYYQDSARANRQPTPPSTSTAAPPHKPDEWRTERP